MSNMPLFYWLLKLLKIKIKKILLIYAGTLPFIAIDLSLSVSLGLFYFYVIAKFFIIKLPSDKKN